MGHNRDGEDLRQTNIALVTDEDGVPVMFRMLSGSVADMAILQSTVDDMKRPGCDCRLVMDRGFENAGNISALLDLDVDFTVPPNAKAEPIKKLITMAVSDMEESGTYMFHEGSMYKAVEYEAGIIDIEDGHEYIIRVPENHKDSAGNNRRFEGSRKLKAFVVFDPIKAAGNLNSMMSAINNAELMLNNTKPRGPEKKFRKLAPFIKRHLNYSVDDDGVMHIERKNNAMTFTDNRASMFVMLSSRDTTTRTDDDLLRCEGPGGEGLRRVQERSGR